MSLNGIKFNDKVLEVPKDYVSTKDIDQEVNGNKVFTGNLKVRVNEGDDRFPLLAPYTTTTSKRYLVVTPDTNNKITAINKSVYQEGGKLYSDSKQVATVDQVVNENLLPNSNFRINTNGLSEYTANGICVDDWNFSKNGTKTLTLLENGGVKINTTVIGTWTNFNTVLPFLGVGNYVLTFNVSDTSRINQIFVSYPDPDTGATKYPTRKELSRTDTEIVQSITSTTPINNLTIGIQIVEEIGECDIYWAKLEAGTIATPYVAPTGVKLYSDNKEVATVDQIGDNSKLDDVINNEIQIKSKGSNFRAGSAKESTSSLTGTVAIGNSADASANYATSVGYGAKAGGNAVTIGNQANGSTNSVTIGNLAQNTSDGVSIGNRSSNTGSGVTIGNSSKTTSGSSIGYESYSSSGVSIGYKSAAGEGVSIGYNANVKNNGTTASPKYINAIQIGTGTNEKEKSLQVYGDNIYDANTHTLTVQNIDCPNMPTPNLDDYAKLEKTETDVTLPLKSEGQKSIDFTDTEGALKSKIRCTQAGQFVFNSSSYYFRNQANNNTGLIVTPTSKIIYSENDNEWDLGSTSKRFKDLYIAGSMTATNSNGNAIQINADVGIGITSENSSTYTIYKETEISRRNSGTTYSIKIPNASGTIALINDLVSYNVGICSTTADTKSKTVTLANFILGVNRKITVRFTTANNVSSPTLNVNNTGDKPMKYGSSTTYLAWKAGEVMDLMYDGESWCIIGGYSLSDKPVNTRWIQYNGESTPGTLFGGTWTTDTDYTGRTLIGSGTGYSLGATGGSANAVVVTHRHTAKIMAGDGGVKSDGNTLQRGYQGTGRDVYAYNSHYDGTDEYFIDEAGESGVNKNLPPYKVVTIWKRTG